MRIYLPSFCLLLLLSCGAGDPPTSATTDDTPAVTSVNEEGVRMIPIETDRGAFEVWTQRIGDNPQAKVLLLHGGPGMTHEYLESFGDHLPGAGIEFYYYDQLESHNSDQPGDTSLWSVDRYVNEVEQVRQALGLNKDNFFLFGSSWGGILCMEYALKHQENLKGLIISNMVSSIPDYNRYADEVLGPQLPPEVLAEVRELEAAGNYTDPRYAELLFEHFYTEHVLRRPLDEWPDAVNRSFEHANNDLYLFMQGPSEFGIVGDAKLKNWSVKDRLHEISVPTLTIGGTYDTMDPEHMRWMADEVQNGRYLHCPEGSHLSMWDDEEVYFSGLIDFVQDVVSSD